jgi:class 3 adenylate cyclase/tetratricopeptide (TPR) repeat protein
MAVEEQTKTRKLAAVMFTDMEGYTSMFQANETSAMDKLQIHRQYLESATKKNNGHIIKFYGDGSLAIYDSVMDAMRSAIEIQKVSMEHQLPVRIGIHIGDVIYKEDDVYGDAVNVASRIQSMGIPGSVVVSKKVADEIKNQPDIGLKLLGKYSLKNVNERMELYAVTGNGLNIPVRKSSLSLRSTPLYFLLIGIVVFITYLLFFNQHIFKSGASQLKEELIIIPPFEDLTSNPEYSSIGEIASSIITLDLNSLYDANIVGVASALLYTDADMASMVRYPSLARQTGATNMIKGYYSLTGAQHDSLLFWANLIDIKTKATLPFPISKITCRASDYMNCIKDMSSSIRGYWKSKTDNVFRYPNNDAYIAYLKAQKIWANPDPSIQKKAKEYLIQSIGFDSLFLDAYFLLLDDFSNHGEYENEKDTIELIRTRFPELTPRQENYLGYYEEELNGRNLEEYNHFIKEYPNDPKDLFLNTTGMVLAVEYLNDPAMAIRFSDEINMDSLDLKTCTYCRTRVNMALQAYMDLEDTINADRMAARLKPFAQKSSQYIRLIAHYIKTGDTISIKQVFDNVAKNAAPESDDLSFAYLMAGRYAMLNGDNKLRDYYAGKAIALYGKTLNRELGRCYYLKGDLDAAEKIFNSELAKKPDHTGLISDLGLVYARRGQTTKANEVITKLEGMKKAYDLGKTTYYQGRIKAVLGENEAALNYLTKAMDEGVKFYAGTNFQHDPDLIQLMKEEKYNALIKRYRK